MLVTKPDLSLWQKCYLPEVVRGLWITIRHLIRFKPVTCEYPEKPYPVPANFRGLHRLILRPNGMENNKYVPESERISTVPTNETYLRV